jgi:hypothetical protein
MAVAPLVSENAAQGPATPEPPSPLEPAACGHPAPSDMLSLNVARVVKWQTRQT